MYFQILQYNFFSLTLSKSPYFYCFKGSTGVWVTLKVIYIIRKYDNTEHSVTARPNYVSKLCTYDLKKIPGNILPTCFTNRITFLKVYIPGMMHSYVFYTITIKKPMNLNTISNGN